MLEQRLAELDDGAEPSGVTFGRHGSDELRTLTRLLLQHTAERLTAQHVTVEFGDDAVDWVAEHGRQPEFGARPLRRTIQREVDDRLADLLLDGELTAGARVLVGAAGGGLTFATTRRPALG